MLQRLGSTRDRRHPNGLIRRICSDAPLFPEQALRLPDECRLSLDEVTHNISSRERPVDLLSLFFSYRGRTRRGDFWYALLVVMSVLIVLDVATGLLFDGSPPLLCLVPILWSLSALCVTRYHDIGRSGWWLLLLAIPILGPAWVLFSVGFRKGHPHENRYGAPPDANELDYLAVERRGHPDTLVNDVTGLNPVEVRQTIRPRTVEELQTAIAESTGPVSIGGGRFSMGGQTASTGSLHLDMRSFNRVLQFSPAERWIRVQTGARWCDIQRFLDPHDLSVKIMQTYANFTVGGSLSVNSHGRYIGLGPLILSVREIRLVLADGSLVAASPTENSEIFYGAIGGYGGLGVIVEAELDVAENCRVGAETETMPVDRYAEYFRRNVRDDGGSLFHNADIYPPHYSRVRATTWKRTDKPVTQTNRLMPLRSSFPLERYFFWAISETPTGKWRREHLIDPMLFFRQKVHWRNYEASYDAAELEPRSRDRNTYVLQEYFVPVDRFDGFLPQMAEILQRHGVNAINISIRHAIADPGSLLAWAREEVFALVMYYKQGVDAHDRGRVAVWTRELIEAVIEAGGAYYLPYQPHATAEQFHRAYPRARELFALKDRLDPDFRFRNVLWDRYYAPEREMNMPDNAELNGSEFRSVFATTKGSDDFYLFLQNIFHLYPEDRFHALIVDACGKQSADREIYETVQAGLPDIKPFLADLTYALPALKKQKQEMTRQTLELFGDRKSIDGYLEIGSTGRYISRLRKELRFSGPLYLTNDIAPGNGPGDIMERGQIGKVGTFFPLDYQPLDSQGVAAESLDMVTCYIGLHHAPEELLDGFVRSIHRALRPGGLFIMRDHDAGTEERKVFCSLVHTVFNLGINVPWADNEREVRRFASAEEWSHYVSERGFREPGPRLLQDHDPSINTLMAFVKPEGQAAS
jgi:FAD/FMN-containing dehydrogenase/uncharacterized membrane protein YhaH (DUF805 family)